MDKSQAIQQFWGGFGLKAYDENTVPDDAAMPYITYATQTDSIGATVYTSASLWYYTNNWRDITRKADEIASAIVNMNPPAVKIDGGRMYISKGSPFAQRMSDEASRDIRRILLQVNIEFLTNA